uniref:Glucokinase n=1 Tax=Globisporangium ultimum (strain ATCC 200006 / CBS 805.95 / DAOM BR144) TaxID=431595 RepID=K3WIP5_GLOUD
MSSAGDLIISGDCGGTNTRLSLWLIPKGAKHFNGNVAPGEITFAKKYHNENHSSFSEVCHLFMKEANLNGRVPVACVLACAGPILDNTVEFTNIKFGWKINGPCLERELGIKTVRLINDFAAMGYGLLTLKPHEYIVLNDAPKEEGAPIATIGAGTGLGECYLTAGNDGQYSCFACEGGHTDFAPANKLEIEIYEDLKKTLGCAKRFSVERIISGPGLATVYEFLTKKFPEKVNKKIYEEFAAAKSLQGKVVGDHAKTDELCNQAMEIFVDAYGREAGNAMLKYLPRGGFYITGGLAPKNLDYFTKKDIFLKAAFDKGRVSPAIQAVPVYLVLTEDLGERGAHYYAYQLLKAYNKAHGLADTVKHSITEKFASNNQLALYTVIAAIGVLIGASIGAVRRF